MNTIESAPPALLTQLRESTVALHEKLGFKSFGGDGKKWLILQNETTTIGLFEGMFDKNLLTFNPGWDHKAQTLPQFDDVRDIQKQLKAGGIIPVKPADENGTAFWNVRTGRDYNGLFKFLSSPRGFDERIETPGGTFFIDGASVLYLVGSTMDWQEDDFTAGFVFNNPNAKGTCGCGESFTI